MNLLYDNLNINEAGHLTIGGVDAVSLAEEYGTPLYVLDENIIRKKCRIYTEAMTRYFGNGSVPLFAGKALCFKGIYPIVEEEGLSADVVSPGEIYTALAAGFPAEKIYFHGNNKTDAARIGFDDSFIYDELALKREDRNKAMEELLPDEAIAAFQAWEEKADKVEY